MLAQHGRFLPSLPSGLGRLNPTLSASSWFMNCHIFFVFNWENNLGLSLGETKCLGLPNFMLGPPIEKAPIVGIVGRESKFFPLSSAVQLASPSLYLLKKTL